jgi:small subunit ribosomal protein S2
MSEVGLKDLLQAGVHFGHQTHRWNPKMRKFIFAERGGIYLIDLKKTLRELNRARDLVRETVRRGGNVLFVCTKPQLKATVRSEAEKCGAFYVTERWLGGMLTNFQTIKKNIKRLKELERGVEEGAFEFYTKKEQLLLERERQKLDRYLAGIKDMTRLPGLVFVVDAKKEEIAVREANRLNIPVVAIADTNADPDVLTVPIAGNDDAIRSVSLISRVIAEEIDLARREMPEMAEAADEEVFTYSSDVGETETAAGGRKKRPKRRPRPELIKRRRRPTESDDTSAAASGSDAAESVEAEADKAEVEKAEAEEAETPILEGAAAETGLAEVMSEETPAETVAAAEKGESADDGGSLPSSS